MILYSLTCPNDHGFDSWFASAAAFADLQTAGRISCPQCGSSGVGKALMAPAVRPARGAAIPEKPLSQPPTESEAALAAARRAFEETSDYVGGNFVAEARAMHAGESEARSIWGEARFHEARALIEEGVPVAPLPFVPARRTN